MLHTYTYSFEIYVSIQLKFIHKCHQKKTKGGCFIFYFSIIDFHDFIIFVLHCLLIIIMPLKVVFLDENCRVISYNMHHLFSKTKIFPFLIINLNSYPFLGVEHISGNMFESLPRAEAILLKVGYSFI